MEKIIPTGNRVLVKQVTAHKTYGNSNMYIPEAQQVRERKGTVVSIGENVTEVKGGDLIRYSDHASPIVMMHEGEEHLLINKDAVLAVIVNV